jgi:long-chain fatty acid transport protein
MRRGLLCAAVVLAAAALSVAPLHAQGSAVMTHSSCATALAASGVAAPCTDGSAVLFNPAALAQQQSVLGLGITGITTGGSFTYDFTGQKITRETSTSPVPFGFLNYRFGDRWAAGLGVFAPYGLGVKWPLEFEGRFVSYDTELKNIYIQPTIAFQATPWLAFGAGLDVVLASITLNQRLDLATTGVPGTPFTFANFGIPLGTDFANAHLAGDGTGVTFNAGMIAQLSEKLSFGVRYLHNTKIDYDGDADFTPVATGITLPPGHPFINQQTGQPLVPAGAPIDVLLASQFEAGGQLADQTIATSLTLPATFTIGFAYRPLDPFKVQADYQFTSWKDFGTAQIHFQNHPAPTPLVLDYRNTHTYRVGAEFDATDAIALRGGFIYNTAAEKDASVSPLLPENNRNYYSAGIGWRAFSALTFDAGYQFVHQPDRRGRVRGRTSVAQTAEQLNVGVYSVSAHVFNLTAAYRFGPAR